MNHPWVYSSMTFRWRIRRLLGAVWLFFWIVWRETADGSRMTTRHAWETAGVTKRAREIFDGRRSV
jgi:hypothetical protein